MKCKKTFEERRKIVNNIPEGLYCYDNEKTCNYWEPTKYDKKNYVVRAKCKLYNIEDNYDQDTLVLWDQCKICNIKLGLKKENLI